MKGRGCRVASLDEMKSVSGEDATAKTHFVIVDAVGVSEQDKSASKPLDRQPSVPLDRIMGLVGAGVATPDLVSTLASRLARLGRQLDDDQHQKIAEKAGGTGLAALTAGLLSSLDADAQIVRAKAKFGLGEAQEPTEEQLEQAQGEMMAEALKPLHDPKLRDLIVTMKKSLEQVIDEVTQDDLILAGYDARSLEKAQALVSDFRVFIESNKDELEAIQILYSRPYRAGLRFRQVKELAEALKRPPLSASPEARLAGVRGDRAGCCKGKGRQVADGPDRLGAARPRPGLPYHPVRHDSRGTLSEVVRRAGKSWRRVHERATAMARRHPGPHRQEPADRRGRLRLRPFQPAWWTRSSA